MSFGSTPQVQAPQVNYKPIGLSNPTGYSVDTSGNVSQSPVLASNVGGLQSTFQGGANAFGQLVSTVQPGFSQFRKAGLADITNTFRSNLSNLKQNIAQRGVAGSSFANSSISQAYADEAQAKANFEAQSYLQELGASAQLIQQQYTYATNSFQSAINQSNIESSTAANLTATFNQLNAQAAQTNAQLQLQAATTNANLQAQSQAGTGKLIGTAAAIGLAPFTGGLSLAAIPAFAGGGGGGGGGYSGNYNGPNFWNSPLFNPNSTWT